MKEIQTTAYETDDGKVFVDKRQACEHAIYLVCKEVFPREGIDSTSVLSDILIENADKLAPLLTEIAK